MSTRLSVRQRHTSAAQPVVNNHFHHTIQFYERDIFLIETIGRYVHPALVAGGSAVVLAIKPHRDMLALELTARGSDPKVAAEQGRYFALDAAEVLSEFMIDGWPDEALFKNTLGPLIRRAYEGGRRRRVVAFGEMVALLWAEGKRDAAVQLERLWNELARAELFSLVCAYPLLGFDREEHARLFFNICGEHSDVNPAEGYPAQGAEGRCRRNVARWQQKARALKNDIRQPGPGRAVLEPTLRAGTWEMDLNEELFSFSSQAAGILGVQPQALRLAELLQCMGYSGDRDAFLEALHRARKGTKLFVTEFRIADSGQSRVISIRGRTFYNGGQPLILGVLSDITSAA